MKPNKDNKQIHTFPEHLICRHHGTRDLVAVDSPVSVNEGAEFPINTCPMLVGKSKKEKNKISWQKQKIQQNFYSPNNPFKFPNPVNDDKLVPGHPQMSEGVPNVVDHQLGSLPQSSFRLYTVAGPVMARLHTETFLEGMSSGFGLCPCQSLKFSNQFLKRNTQIRNYITKLL